MTDDEIAFLIVIGAGLFVLCFSFGFVGGYITRSAKSHRRHRVAQRRGEAAALIRKATRLLRSANVTKGRWAVAELRRQAQDCVEAARRLQLAVRRPRQRAEWFCPDE
jgi:hypothetical protein